MFRRRWAAIFTCLLMFSDLLFLNASLLLAHSVCNLRSGSLLPKYLLAIWLAANVIYLVFYIGSGTYLNCSNSCLEHQLGTASRGSIYAGMVLISVAFLIKPGSRFLCATALFLPLQYLCALLSRTGFSRLNSRLRRRGYDTKNTLIFGRNHSAFARFLLHDISRFGYIIKGFAHIAQALYYKFEDGKLHSIKQDNLDKVMDSLEIQSVLIIDEFQEAEKYEEVIKACQHRNIQAKIVSPGFEKVICNPRIHDLIGITLLPNGRAAKAYSKLKRIFDVIFTGVGLILLWPVLILIALIIKLTSKGPVLFVQERSLNGQVQSFNFYKFRSMFANADSLKSKLEHRNVTTGALFKDPEDPRITPIGKIIRKLSIDELPQLLNVIKGDMSIVGPRPLPVRDYQKINGKNRGNGWCEYRAMAKPGITGLWQISGRSDIGFAEMVLMDVYYIENRSLLSDLEILFETLPCIILGKGAY